MHYLHFSDQKTDIRGLPCEVAPTRNGRKNWNWGFLPLKRLVWITTPRLFKFSLFPPFRCRHSLETERSRNGKERLTLRINSVRPANAGSGGSRLHCRKWRSVVVTYSEQKARGGHLRWEGRDPLRWVVSANSPNPGQQDERCFTVITGNSQQSMKVVCFKCKFWFRDSLVV